MKELLDKTLRLLGSFGFACIILLFLALLTFLGTWEQVDDGIYKVQKRYFDTLYVLHEVGPLRVGHNDDDIGSAIHSWLHYLHSRSR